MARFTRIEVALKMQETGIVPVFYHHDAEIAKQILKACYNGGIRVFEFTNRGDYAHQVFDELGKFARDEAPKMILGAGSVVDAPTASLYIQLGSNFIVSPVLVPEMARVCNRRKILWSPGCGSLTEISDAEELGSEIVKIFPGSQVGGSEFVKAVKGPFPWTSIMPTGGVSPDKENLKTWFDAGVACVGMGSKLFPQEYIKKGDFQAITDIVKNTMDNVRKIRKHSV